MSRAMVDIGETQEIPKVSESTKDLLYEKVLKPRGVEIVPPKKYDLPREYNTSQIPKEDRPVVEKTIRVFENFLKAPIIKDRFQNHDERRQWRHDTYRELLNQEGPEMADAFSTLIKENKLRRNKLALITGYTDMISDYLPKALTQKVQEVSEKFSATRFRDPWGGPVTPYKLQVVEETSDAVVEILNHFGKK